MMLSSSSSRSTKILYTANSRMVATERQLLLSDRNRVISEFFISRPDLPLSDSFLDEVANAVGRRKLHVSEIRLPLASARPETSHAQPIRKAWPHDSHAGCSC